MLYRTHFLRPCVICYLVLLLVSKFAVHVHAVQRAPLTLDQVVAMAGRSGTLKAFPNDVISRIRERGVNFFPNKSTLDYLRNESVVEGVVSAVREQATSQLRIKVCQIECVDCGDASLADELTREMLRNLPDAKSNYIEPLGLIPLDDRPCPSGGFDSNVTPLPKTFYILLRGWIRRTPSGHSLDTQVLFRDLSGNVYPLPNANGSGRGQAVNRQNIRDTARQVINGGIAATREYASK